MRRVTKIIMPAILAVSLVAIAGCDSASQAQTTDKLTAQVTSTQAETSNAAVEPITEPITESVRPSVKKWQVKAEESHLKFTALQEGEKFEGEFKDFTADINFHPDNLEDSIVTVTVPLSGADAGNTDRNSTLPGKVWFSAKTFPEAVFTANVFKPMDDGAYVAVGELTIKGVSRPLSLPFTLDLDGDIALMRSMIEMNRTEWNIGEKPWNTDEWVSTDVQLHVVVTAQQQN